jgi:hypothetical protein
VLVISTITCVFQWYFYISSSHNAATENIRDPQILVKACILSTKKFEWLHKTHVEFFSMTIMWVDISRLSYGNSPFMSVLGMK